MNKYLVLLFLWINASSLCWGMDKTAASGTNWDQLENILVDIVREGDFDELNVWLPRIPKESPLQQNYLLNPIKKAMGIQGHDMLVVLLKSLSIQNLGFFEKELVEFCLIMPNDRLKWDALEKLVNEGLGLHYQDQNRLTLLHFAAKNGQKELARILLEKGAPVDVFDLYGNTPLATVINFSQGNTNKDLIILLLENGADAKAKRSKEQLSAYELAENLALMDSTALETINETWERLANSVMPPTSNIPEKMMPVINPRAPITRDLGNTLISAIQNKLTTRVKDHLSNDPHRVNEQDGEDNTPLHWAVKNANIEYVKLLLNHNADPLKSNNKKETPVSLAANLPSILELLQNHLNKIDESSLKTQLFIEVPKKILALGGDGTISAQVYFEPGVRSAKIHFEWTDTSARKPVTKKKSLSFASPIKSEETKFTFIKSKAPLTFDGDPKTHNEKTKKAINGRYWFVKNLVVQKQNGKLYLSGETNLYGKFSWELTADKVPAARAETPHEKFSDSQKPKALPKPAIIKNFPTAEELVGLYVGELNGERFEVTVPALDGAEIVSLGFAITKNNGAVIHNELWVRPEMDLNNAIFQFEPVSDTGNGYKLAPGTTFNGNRSKGKDGTLRFTGKIAISEVIKDSRTTLSVATHRGELRVYKQNPLQDGAANPAPPADVAENAILEEREEQWDLWRTEMAPHFEEYVLEEMPAIVPPSSVPNKPKRKKKPAMDIFAQKPTKEQRYNNIRLGFTTDELDRAERDRVKLAPKMKELADKLDAEDAARLNNQQISSGFAPAKVAGQWVPEPRRLDPESQFTNNPLFGENLWLANAWVSKNGAEPHPDGSKNFAIAFTNFNGWEQFAPSASWCSLFTRAQAASNFQNGTNVHCSYHDNGGREYLNISHFGLFHITTTIEGTYLLNLVPKPGSTERVVYTLRPGSSVHGNWKIGNKPMSMVQIARHFTSCPHDSFKQLEEEARIEKLHGIGERAVAQLLAAKPLEVRYGGLTLSAVFIDQKTGHFQDTRGHIWRKMESYSVQMINENIAFISILFVNNHNRLEAITTKINLENDTNILAGS